MDCILLDLIAINKTWELLEIHRILCSKIGMARREYLPMVWIFCPKIYPCAFRSKIYHSVYLVWHQNNKQNIYLFGPKIDLFLLIAAGTTYECVMCIIYPLYNYTCTCYYTYLLNIFIIFHI